MSVEGQAQLISEFVNEYGQNLEQLRANTLSDTQIVNSMVHGPLRKWLKNHAGVLALKMTSEILLLLGELPFLRPMMV